MPSALVTEVLEMASEAFKWYVSHPDKLWAFVGKQVAVVDDQVAGFGDSAREAFDMARLTPFTCTLLHVLEEHDLRFHSYQDEASSKKSGQQDGQPSPRKNLLVSSGSMYPSNDTSERYTV